MMEQWRTAWRDGFVPQLSRRDLEVLRDALRDDDPRLIQGNTTSPPPLVCTHDFPAAGACAISYCGWQGEGLKTVGEVEEFFAEACDLADELIGEPAACRWFLDWFDDHPRELVRRKLLAEVERALSEVAS